MVDRTVYTWLLWAYRKGRNHCYWVGSVMIRIYGHVLFFVQFYPLGLYWICIGSVLNLFLVFIESVMALYWISIWVFIEFIFGLYWICFLSLMYWAFIESKTYTFYICNRLSFLYCLNGFFTLHTLVPLAFSPSFLFTSPLSPSLLEF